MRRARAGGARRRSRLVVEITCTSIAPPAARITALMTEPLRQLGPARLRRLAPEHELGRVLGPGELDERLGHVGADDLVVAAAELLEQRAVRLERQLGGAPASPSPAATCTPSSSPLRARARCGPPGG